MKVKDIFETVVDFQQARANRDRELAVAQKTKEIERNDQAEEITVEELAEFEEWMVFAKAKGRVPGFDTMDDAVAFIIGDCDMPQHITRAKAIRWFGDLSEDERAKVRMIAHHADRMIQIYDVLKTKIHGLLNSWTHRFGGKLPTDWDAIEGAVWLDQEFSYDVKQLKNLKAAVEILGQ